jgi:hypothetical protein
MTKFAFYILEQPLPLRSPTPGGEYKETDENLPYSNCGEVTSSFPVVSLIHLLTLSSARVRIGLL